jgi:hypothetical protein
MSNDTMPEAKIFIDEFNLVCYSDIGGCTAYTRTDLVEALIEATQHFVDKCDSGRARSVESYTQFKEAIAALEKGNG